MPDEKVKVTSNDITADYLLNKLLSGNGISLTELNDGGDEDLQINVGLTNSDYYDWSGASLGTSWQTVRTEDISNYIGRKILVFAVLGVKTIDAGVAECRVSYADSVNGTRTELNKTWCRFQGQGSGNHFHQFFAITIHIPDTNSDWIFLEAKMSNGSGNLENYHFGYIIIG